MKTKKSNAVIFVLGLIAVLVFLNLLSLRGFARFDLTRDKKYTLSKASVETVQNLKDLMTVNAYFTENLPPPYAQHARYVNDLLVEYLSAAKGKFAFEFSDPAASETSEDKAKKKDLKRDIFGRIVREQTSVEQELAELGVQPVEIRVIEGDQQLNKAAYMGIVIRYQEKYEVIPVVQDLADLEKEMTGLMRKLTREKTPKIGLIKASGVNIQKISQAINQNASLEILDLKNTPSISPDFDALLVVGSSDDFGDSGSEKIQNFLDAGKSAAFLLDRISVDTRTFQYQPISPTSSVQNIFELLKTYGINIGTSIVADASCASLNVQEDRGGFSFSVPVKYPFVPELMNLSFESPITRGLSGVILPFPANITQSEQENMKSEVLASSTKVSWLENEPLDINPRRNWGEADIVPDGPHNLMVQVRGTSKTDSSKEFRIVASGTSMFMWDDFLADSNRLLALNIVDWMLADAALLEMRSRTFTDAPLDANLSDNLKQAVKFGNILGVPCLLVIYGLIRWRAREARRRSLKIN